MRVLRRTGPVLLILTLAIAVSLPHWLEPVRWTDPDAFFYQGHVLALRGQDERGALRRLFGGPLGRQLKPAKLRDPSRISYGRRLFKRRWLVPLLAAAIYPIAGIRSLLTVSLLAYVLLGVALYALLRRRFDRLISTAVAIGAVLAPPVRFNSFVPMTDSFGLLLEILALLVVVLAFDRGRHWIAVWIVVLAGLSLTRDNWLVPLVAVGCIALIHRERRAALLAASGVVAVLPAFLVFHGASVQENLAYVLNNFNPPGDRGWAFIAREYPPELGHWIRMDVAYWLHLGWQTPLWCVGAALAAAGVILLVWAAPGDDAFFRLHRYALLGAAAFLLASGPGPGLRLELVFVPSVAVGLAVLLRSLVERAGARRLARAGA